PVNETAPPVWVDPEDAKRSAPGQQPEPAFAAAKGRPGGAALGDLDEHAVPRHNTVCVVADGLASVRHPSDAMIACEQPVLEAERGQALDLSAPLPCHALAILRMHPEVPHAGLDPLLGAVREHVVELGRG